MFSFGQQEALAKTGGANKKKPSRRISLADRSRNDENAMPPMTPRGHRGPMGKGPLQNQQAFLQTAMPSAPAACPASTSPSRQGGSGGGGRGGGGGSTATQMVNQNFELKRRQQELESMVQSSEAATSQLQERNSQLQEQNRQLQEQNTRARAELEESNARADRASAEAEGLRGEAKSKSAEIAGLRRDAKMASTETASLRHDAKTASAEIASLKRKAETAKAESASLRREATAAVEEAASALGQTRAEAEAATARAEAAEKLGVQERKAVAQAEDAARKATKALKAEAAKAAKAAAAAKAATQAAATAKATAAAANQAAAAARASAAADVAAAASAAAAAAAQQAESENSLRRRSDVLSLAASLEALAAGGSAARTTDTSSQSTTGKKRGRGSATPGTGPRTTAVEPTDEVTAPAGTQSRSGGGTTGGGGGYVELPELTKGFCGFLAAYTAQGLPLDALVELIQTTPSAGGRGGVDNSDGVERGDVPPPPRVTATERAKKKSREATAVKLGKPTALVLPPPAAATATPAPAPVGDSLSADPADAAAAMTTPPESVVPTARPTTTRREMLNARRAEKEREAREKERIQEEKERERAERQREARKKRKQEAALQKAAEAAARQQADEARKKAAETEAATAAAAAAAAAAATAPAAVLSSPSVPSLSQEQEQEQEQRGETKPLRAHNTKSKRVKPVKQAPLPRQQAGQPHGQKRAVGGTEARNRKHSVNVSSSSSDAAPADKAELPNAASVHAVAAAAATTDLDEVGGAVVEEVPMPTGDIDDGFFCADVGGVGGSNSVGLIVGGGGGSGGGDGNGMVGAWSHQGDGSIAAVGSGSGAALDSGPGEKKKRGKGRSRKPEAVVEPLNMGARGVEGGESGDEGSGKESKKKKRRRSMRLVKAPVKFGDEEPGAGGPLIPEPKLDQSKGLAPKLELTLAGTAASGQGSESSGRDSSSVDNASVSHVPFSEGGTAAAATVATSAAIIPAAASQVAASASAETAKPTAEAAGGAGGAAAAAQHPSGRTTAEATASQQQAPPFAKRKPAALANSTKWIRANRFRGGATAATCATAGAAAAPPISRENHPKATSDFLAAAAAAAAAEGAATTSPTDSISATATAAKMAVDDLFDTAVLQLSAATPPSQQAAATKTVVGGGGGREKARWGCAGEGVPTGGERASKAKPNAWEVEVAVTEAVVAERLLPYGAEVTDGVTAKDIFEAASSRSWLGDGGGADGGPRGALTGVLATARVLMQKASGPGGASSLQSAVPPEAMRQFESFLTAIVATEACAMKHELRAGTEAGETVPPSAGAGVAAAAAKAAKAAGGKKKGVRFCAFDLSTVDMPTDAIEDSDAAAKEVAQCLTRVVASSKLLQEGMPKRASGAGGAGKAAAVADGGIGGGLASVVKAFMRGLKTVAGVAEPDSCPLVASARGACRELGTEISTEVVKRAAALLLESFEALEGGAEVAATRCPLRQRLAIMLSALIRFNLRTLLNPPPPKSLSSLHIADSTDKPRKVHEVILLVSEESKHASKKDAFDPTRDGAASAVLSRALRRLYKFSDKGAVEVMSSAEAFVADMKGKKRDIYGDEEKASRARLHSQSTVDIVAAIRARNFVLELLEFPGVELAVSQARGWGELERLSTELRK
ncbi:unnamed protein product [Ectocarpus sp. 6 AP-2014]